MSAYGSAGDDPSPNRLPSRVCHPGGCFDIPQVFVVPSHPVPSQLVGFPIEPTKSKFWAGDARTAQIWWLRNVASSSPRSPFWGHCFAQLPKSLEVFPTFLLIFLDPPKAIFSAFDL